MMVGFLISWRQKDPPPPKKTFDARVNAVHFWRVECAHLVVRASAYIIRARV